MTVSLADMKIFDSPASTILVTNSEGARYAIAMPRRVLAEIASQGIAGAISIALRRPNSSRPSGAVGLGDVDLDLCLGQRRLWRPADGQVVGDRLTVTQFACHGIACGRPLNQPGFSAKRSSVAPLLHKACATARAMCCILVQRA